MCDFGQRCAFAVRQSEMRTDRGGHLQNDETFTRPHDLGQPYRTFDGIDSRFRATGTADRSRCDGSPVPDLVIDFGYETSKSK